MIRFSVFIAITVLFVCRTFSPCTPTPAPTPTPTPGPGLALAVQAWSDLHPNAPFVAMVGDSIMEGYPNFVSRSDGGPCGGGPCGNASYDIATVLYGTSGNLVTGTNDGVCNTKMAFISNKANTKSVIPPPKYLIVEGGINNLHAGDTFASQQTYFDAIKAGCNSHGATMLVEEIWPAMIATNSAILSWNSSLDAWADSNSVTVIAMHDWMADPSDHTRMLADYTWDGTHPTQAGVRRHADKLFSTLQELNP